MVISPKRWDNNPYSGGYVIKDLRPAQLGSTIGELKSKNQQSTDEVAHAL